jgi:hypothetical protein
MEAVTANERAGGPHRLDPMLEGSWKATELMSRRVVVELFAEEYRALEAACGGRCITAAELVRVVALRLARAA